LRQILTQANKPILGSPLIKSSATSSIYQDMITSQLAEQVSKSGSFGLAKSLSHQLGHELRTAQAQQQSAAQNISIKSKQIK
jgi:Rod binding domain-containing protein